MTIFVEMAEQDIAKKWLRENGYVAVKWSVMDAIVNKKTGKKVVVYDPKMPTFLLISKTQWRRQNLRPKKKVDIYDA